MDQLLPTGDRRALTPAQIANRRAKAMLRPYISQLSNWNERAAKSGAMLHSYVATPADKTARQEELAQILSEVEAALAEFETVVATQPSHSRVVDVRSAFLRLKSTLLQF